MAGRAPRVGCGDGVGAAGAAFRAHACSTNSRPQPKALPGPTPSATSRASASSSTTVAVPRSEEHTSELQSRENLVCRLLLEKKKKGEKFKHNKQSCNFRKNSKSLQY